MLAVVGYGVLLFLAPGVLLLRAGATRLPVVEIPAYAFAASLVLLFVDFSAVTALGLPLSAGLPGLAVTTLIVATATALWRRRCGDDPAVEGAEAIASDPAPRWWPPLLAALVVLSALAASSFASVGSIDRWWYLAYVRGYLQGDVLRISEPFLGTGHVFARFGVHPWLMGLALWAQTAATDPVWLYERAAPVLVLVAAISATIALTRSVFGAGSSARIAVVATLLTWSGGLLPVLARAGEDKVLAQAALASVCLASCLAALRERRRGALLLVTMTAIAAAATHALVFAFVLAAWLPFALLRGFGNGGERRRLLTISAILLLVSVQPAMVGLMVERSLSEAGASATEADHPVLRVHESRERTLDAGRLGFVVHPRLLAHPLVLLALAGLCMTARRRRDVGADFLLATTATALLLAFVPPLPSVLGHVIPPWMVYRILWILPLGGLAAVGAQALVRRLGLAEAGALTLALAVSALPLFWSVEQRLGEARTRRAAPTSAEFASLIEAVAALPDEALVVAAPELAERLPALTGHHVVAGLDRSTIMFAGSRDRGEARLRLRAATLIGDRRTRRFAGAASVQPAYVVFDPRAAALPACAGDDVFGSESYAVCRLAEFGEAAGGLALARSGPFASSSTRASAGAEPVRGCTATCSDARGARGPGDLVAASQPDDWSAAPTVVHCRIRCEPGAAAASPLGFEIAPVVGRAVDEVLITARGFRGGDEVYVATAEARTSAGAPLRYALPSPPQAPQADTVELQIASAFLPFVKLREVAWEVSGPDGDPPAR